MPNLYICIIYSYLLIKRYLTYINDYMVPIYNVTGRFIYSILFSIIVKFCLLSLNKLLLTRNFFFFRNNLVMKTIKLGRFNPKISIKSSNYISNMLQNATNSNIMLYRKDFILFEI